MTLYYNVQLCVTLDDPLFHCMTMFDSGRLNWTLYDSPWPCMPLYYPLWMILNYSFGISLSILPYSYCFIPFNCLNLFEMFNSVRKCSTHAVTNKFWACQLNMFRMIQNDAKWTKWFKKVQKEFTVFKLCLRNLDFVSSYAPMQGCKKIGTTVPAVLRKA